MNKQEVVALLKTNVCKVVFEKADKSVREMICTLKDEHIKIESAGRSVPANDLVVTVWDMEKDEWRAFRMDRLISGPEVVEYTPA